MKIFNLVYFMSKLHLLCEEKLIKSDDFITQACKNVHMDTQKICKILPSNKKMAGWLDGVSKMSPLSSFYHFSQL